MTKDFKQSHTHDSETTHNGLGWMISGIAIGLLVGLGMYFYNKYEIANPPTNTDQQVTQDPHAAIPADENSADPILNDAEAPNINDLGLEEPDPISVVIENSRKEQQEKKRASFSYYAVLPNLELDVTVKPSKHDIPDEEVVIASSDSETGKEPATEKLQLKSGSYLLQIASFRTMGQATTAQKKLAKKGLEANIEKKKIRGKDWYRLFIGPTEAEGNIASWKGAVEKVGYKPLIIKVK